jgi:hypothetical protein
MSTYTVETIIRGYHVYREVWEAAVQERGNVHVTSLLAATILEDGTTVGRRRSSFGSVERG